jgi:wyosine [tRNA(Phe)-imidazoG37] synthetase (radical SAM superfamily)
MAFAPVVHEPCDSVRFGRVLFVEIAPGPPPGRPGRYENVLARSPETLRRTHYSAPEAVLRAILTPLDRGAAVDAVVFGGPGDPLRHRSLGPVLRRLRTSAHVTTVVLTDGILLRDRDTRREAGEAGIIAAWLPALEDSAEDPRGLERREAFEVHVEGVASLRRETPTGVALELPVHPGRNDTRASVEAWARCVRRIRPDRVFVIPAPDAAEEGLPDALERVRQAVHASAGAFLDDSTIVDRRDFSGS